MSRKIRQRVRIPRPRATKKETPRDRYGWTCPAKNWHHRQPVCQGGTTTSENLSYVNFNKHRAYHQLFGVTDTYEVAIQLNKTWLPLDWILLPIPTSRALEVLEVLRQMGVVPFEDPIRFGITQTHLDFYGEGTR